MSKIISIKINHIDYLARIVVFLKASQNPFIIIKPLNKIIFKNRI